MKRLLLIAVLAGLAIAAGEYQPYSGGKVGVFTVSDDLDTAQVVRVGDVFLMRDSFVYIDSFSISADTTTHATISWLSPLQTMILTPTFDASTTYSCSLRTGAGATGFSFDATAESNLAGLTAKLTDSINLVAGIKDTIVGQDSSTYVKMVSEMGQNALPSDARWSLSFAVAGGSGTLDTATQLTINDSILIKNMVDSINAGDSTGFYLTAAVEADTSYSVTANKKGVLFFIATQKDTAGDTLHITVNATSVSTSRDSVQLGSSFGYKTLTGIFIVSAATGHTGSGINDSIIMWLYATDNLGGLYVLDSSITANTPGTLNVAIHSNVGDTAMKSGLEFKWFISDTASDTNLAVTSNLQYQVTLK